MAFERVKRARSGGFRLRIPPREREILRALPAQLRELLEHGDAGSDPGLRRLFPPASSDDEALNAEFERLVRDDLVRERLRATEVMATTIDAERLSEDELLAWLSAINDLRLVLGMRLGVTEETTAADFATLPDDDPRVQMYVLYTYLTFLEDHVVEALASG